MYEVVMFYLVSWYVGLFLVVVFGGGIVVAWSLRSFDSVPLPDGLPNAGAYIGYLERFLIVVFLLTGTPSLIGFVLTVKAIYRFGDIQGDNTTKMKLSEYFLIGTLISLSWAIGIYYLFLLFQPAVA